MNNSKLKVFSANANHKLGEEIAEYLGVALGSAKVKTFADGEIAIEISESVRGCDIFIVQPTCAPVNDNLMELLIMIDAMRRASAARITAVINACAITMRKPCTSVRPSWPRQRPHTIVCCRP